LFLSTGSICIYYGTETLLDGAHDPDNRRPMPWNHLNEDFIDFVANLSKIRKKYASMTSAQSFVFVFENDCLKLRFLHEPIECWINIQKYPIFVNVDDIITKTYVETLPSQGVLITQV